MTRETQVMQAVQPYTLRWMLVVFVLFPILILVGVSMRAVQGGHLAGMESWFYPAMTLHGVGMVAVWYVASIAGFRNDPLLMKNLTCFFGHTLINLNLASVLLFLGLAGWAIGGIGALIDSTISANVRLHNTLWVPAHFHAYNLAGLVFLVLAYFLHVGRNATLVPESTVLRVTLVTRRQGAAAPPARAAVPRAIRFRSRSGRWHR